MAPKRGRPQVSPDRGTKRQKKNREQMRARRQAQKEFEQQRRIEAQLLRSRQAVAVNPITRAQLQQSNSIIDSILDDNPRELVAPDVGLYVRRNDNLNDPDHAEELRSAVEIPEEAAIFRPETWKPGSLDELLADSGGGPSKERAARKSPIQSSPARSLSPARRLSPFQSFSLIGSQLGSLKDAFLTSQSDYTTLTTKKIIL